MIFLVIPITSFSDRNELIFIKKYVSATINNKVSKVKGIIFFSYGKIEIPTIIYTNITKIDFINESHINENGLGAISFPFIKLRTKSIIKFANKKDKIAAGKNNNNLINFILKKLNIFKLTKF